MFLSQLKLFGKEVVTYGRFKQKKERLEIVVKRVVSLAAEAGGLAAGEPAVPRTLQHSVAKAGLLASPGRDAVF